MTQAHIWESTRDRAAAFQRRTVRAACAGATAVALVVGGFAAPAFADEYPSWEDVKAAQSTEAAQAALVAQIKADLAALQQEVAAATALVEKRGQEYFDAQQTFDDKTFEASELQRQADEAHAAADASKHQAGLLASQLARTAGGNLSGNLFVSGEDRADDLLYQLGAMSKLSEKTDQIYVKARQQQNTAQSLTDQANVAKEQLGALADAAQKALDESVAAQQALEAKQAEDEQHRADLEAQLAVLVQKADITEAQFQVGEQRRLAAEAAAAAAAAAASGAVDGYS